MLRPSGAAAIRRDRHPVFSPEGRFAGKAVAVAGGNSGIGKTTADAASASNQNPKPEGHTP